MWQPVASLTLSDDWQYSPPVVGEFFQIRHTSTLKFGRGLIAQASLSAELYEVQRLFFKPEADVYQFIQPDCFADRCIALKCYRWMPQPWTVEISVWV